MRKLGISLLLFVAMPGIALAANNNFYWGAMVGKSEYEDPLANSSLLSITGRFGFSLFPFLDIEGRVATSGSESNSTIDNLQVDYLGNVSAKLNFPISNRVNLYGIGGISAWRISYDNAGIQTQFTGDGLSYGIGIELFADENNGLNLEYVRYADETQDGTAYELNHWGLGYVQRF